MPHNTSAQLAHVYSPKPEGKMRMTICTFTKHTMKQDAESWTKHKRLVAFRRAMQADEDQWEETVEHVPSLDSPLPYNS